MDLEELTTREGRWFADAAHQYAGVRETWDEIFKGYVALAQEQGDLEALKRALFLVWFDVADPEWVTGISRLDPEAMRRVFEMLNDQAANADLDEELTWMLPYYYSVADWYLPSEYTGLRKASMENTRLWMTGCLQSSFSNRGQLGRYWEGIQINLRAEGRLGGRR